MSERLRLMCALLLVAVGLVCVIYAVATWQRVELPAQSPQSAAPVRETPAPDEAADEKPAAGIPAKTPAGDVPPVAPPAEGDPADATPEPSQSVAPAAPAANAKMPRAQKEALSLWVLVVLPLVFVVLIVIILVQRWVRPQPMARTGPSDTTDLWQEAGKRLKLQ